MTPDQAVDFIRGVRALLGNRRGSPSSEVTRIIESTMDAIRQEMENVARLTLRSDRSEGPELSQKWQDEKYESWVGNRWYVNQDGDTFEVERPAWISGEWHKNAWSGFLDEKLTSWIGGGNTIGNPPVIYVGYNDVTAVHPVTGAPLMMLVAKAHFGGKGVPARPFLNAAYAMQEYTRIARLLFAGALQEMARSRRRRR